MPHAHHGLQADLRHLSRQLLDRRRTLRWLAAGAALPTGLVACGGGDSADSASAASNSTTVASTGATTSSSTSSSTSASSSGSSSTSTDTATGSCSTIPTETNGPYPADGQLASSQRLNALALNGIVRSDIRTSVGSASGTAAGLPTTVTLTLVNVNGSCAPLSGYAVYVWHCTRDGNYSLYSTGFTGENYLRGVQVTDANGKVTFTTVFPGCYTGRWPHIHFEIYPSLAAATDASVVGDYTKVSQLAVPEAAARAVYGSVSGYASSLTALNQITLASDNVFSDGVTTQLATATGDTTSGYALTLRVGIAA